jgi:geranylgeranyl reductase family protein
MERWDAIIVGAGPAGCAAAYDLATAGRPVLLLDRAEFPRHKACAGGLTRKSLRALRYSVAPVVRETVSAIVVEKQSVEAATLASRNAVCAMTVRQELDHFCLQQTRRAGAEFALIGPISGFDINSDGVVVRTTERDYRARFLIGADGVHSRVRQLLYGESPRWFWRGFALEARVYPTNGHRSDLIFDFAPVRRGYGWVFPKRDHLNVGLGVYDDSGAQKLDRARLSSYIHERFGDARVEHVTGQFLGFGAESAPKAEQRVFLAGDAGGFADPLTGEGIDGELRCGAPAQGTFAKLTTQLRQDLQLSASGARWFYGNLDLGYRALTAPVFRGAVINAYANGTKIGALANAVRRFARIFASRPINKTVT